MNKISHPDLDYKILADFEKKPSPTLVKFVPENVRQRCKDEYGNVLTKGAFAALIGVSVTGYTSMSNHPTMMRAETLSKIMTATGCKLEDLFEVVPA